VCNLTNQMNYFSKVSCHNLWCLRTCTIYRWWWRWWW